MIKDAWEKPLGNEAPERLRGRKVRAILIENENSGGELRFEFDMPEEPTRQELAYMKWFAGEVGEYAGLDLQKLGEPHRAEPYKGEKDGKDSVAAVDGETGKTG